MEGRQVNLRSAIVLTAVIGLLNMPLSAEPLMRGEPAPTFLLPTLSGAQVCSVDLWGKPLILHFWAAPTEEFLPDALALRDFLKSYSRGKLQVLPVAVGRYGRGRAKDARLALGVDWPVALDEDGVVAGRYYADEGSVLYVVDAAGRIVYRHNGFPWAENLQGALERASQVQPIGDARGKVALTFEDFPHEALSRRLLQVLNSERVKATFFVVGQRLSEQSELVKEAAAAGHSLQNGTYSGVNLTGISDLDIWFEVIRTSEALMDLTGKPSAYLRPPGGWYDARTALKVETTGHRPVFWTVDARDTQDATPNAIQNRVIELARDGSIIRMRDGVEATIEALPGIIADLRAKDYKFVAIEELAEHGAGPW